MMGKSKETKNKMKRGTSGEREYRSSIRIK